MLKISSMPESGQKCCCKGVQKDQADTQSWAGDRAPSEGLDELRDDPDVPNDSFLPVALRWRINVVHARWYPHAQVVKVHRWREVDKLTICWNCLRNVPEHLHGTHLFPKPPLASLAQVQEDRQDFCILPAPHIDRDCNRVTEGCWRSTPYEPRNGTNTHLHNGLLQFLPDIDLHDGGLTGLDSRD